MKRILLMQLLPAAGLHLQLRGGCVCVGGGGEDKSEVKCQYAIGQISQPDETQE